MKTILPLLLVLFLIGCAHPSDELIGYWRTVTVQAWNESSQQWEPGLVLADENGTTKYTDTPDNPMYGETRRGLITKTKEIEICPGAKEEIGKEYITNLPGGGCWEIINESSMIAVRTEYHSPQDQLTTVIWKMNGDEVEYIATNNFPDRVDKFRTIEHKVSKEEYLKSEQGQLLSG